MNYEYLCSHCSKDTGGNHQLWCPFHPSNQVNITTDSGTVITLKIPEQTEAQTIIAMQKQIDAMKAEIKIKTEILDDVGLGSAFASRTTSCADMKAENARLKEALEKYGKHLSINAMHCQKRTSPEMICNCGFEQVLRSIKNDNS